MTSRMMTCARCGGVQWQVMVDVQTFGARWSWGQVGVIPGRWEACEDCGWTGAPMTPPRPAPFLAGAPYGPSVPSPDDLLRAADLLW